MTHTLIAGATLTGKTTLLRSIIECRRLSGRDCIIYNPNDDIEGGFSDPLAFVDRLKKCYNVSVFIDEAESIFGRDQSENIWILSRGRHHGFECFVSAHRPQFVNPAIRLHFTQFFIFRVHRSEQDLFEQSFGCVIPDCQTLKQGEYYMGRYLDGEYLVSHGRVF